VQVYNGSGTSFTDSGLDNGVTYYYGAYAYDAWPNYASGVCRNATTPADAVAPGDVTGFVAMPADVCPTIFLSWENPGDEDFAGVKILRKTTGYSFSPTDGTVIYNGPGTNVVDNIDLTENTPYYYTIYAYDGTPNYSLGVRATVTSGDCVAVHPGRA
jgi:cellulose 1,4-beta-cellobiosidase